MFNTSVLTQKPKGKEYKTLARTLLFGLGNNQSKVGVLNIYLRVQLFASWQD